MSLIRRFIRWLTTPEDPSKVASRRGFLRLAAGALAIAQASPLLLLEPAKAGNLLVGSGSVAAALGKNWALLEERIFFQMITSGVDTELLPAIPYAADGVALYSTSIKWSTKTDPDLEGFLEGSNIGGDSL